MEKELIFYGSANSSRGYVTFTDEYVEKCENILILKNASCCVKKDFFAEVVGRLYVEGEELHTIKHCGKEDEEDGFIFPERRTAVVDFSALLKTYKNAKIIDFADEILPEEYFCIRSREKNERSEMYKNLTEAKKIHDMWEEIYISNMDFEKLSGETNKLVEEIFKGGRKNKTSRNVNRFFGTMMDSGSINYIGELTEGIGRRIFIKGRPGTGKSTLMKKIRNEALLNGFDTETYYCSFDPNSLDMVVIRELGTAIFDSTAPHELFPESKRDEIFDIYEIAVKSGTDEKFAREIANIKFDYDEKIKNAKLHLKNAEEYREQAESFYSKNINEEKIRGILDKAVGEQA